ncbi:MAG TPA: peptidoglycan recognition family protein, partial [Lacipirellula sp.]
ELKRTGDEIMVCGKLFHTTAPVVLWTDEGGYDAYRTERRFGPLDKASWEETIKDPGFPNYGPARYGMRLEPLDDEEIETIRGGGWPLPLLQRVVDQFVIHYDVCPVSQTCFKVLHDHRNLSVHFMLDIDGTIYQTLDLKERARHATISNTRSIGIEIANMGAYSRDNIEALEKWYDATGGEIRLRASRPYDELGVRTEDFVGKPARQELICGEIQGRELCQYDFTPEQYESLIKLTATLCKIFPNIKCDYPKDDSGKLIPRKLEDSDWRAYQGVLGHYHVQLNKTDPGPAFQWDKVIGGAKELIEESDN